MPTFTPPTTEGQSWVHPDAKGAERALMKFYSTCPMGKTVWRSLDLVWHEATYPLDTNFQVWRDLEQPNNALVAYHGGHTYEITQQEADDLTAAGYGAFIT